MKKIFAVVAAFLFALPTLAAEEKKMSEKHEMAKGTISAWNDSAKTFTMKDATGKEMSFTFKDNSAVSGMAKTGEMAMVKYTTDKDGKMMAHHVFVGQEEIAKAEKAMQDKKMEKAGAH